MAIQFNCLRKRGAGFVGVKTSKEESLEPALNGGWAEGKQQAGTEVRSVPE